jgi:hypothetical protein
MRTTLDIEDDILSAAKELARSRQVSTSRMISSLLREALTGRPAREMPDQPATKSVGGFRPFPARGVLVTNEQVNNLRDQEGV